MSTSTPGDPRAARPARLNGWKEIAAYLDRGVRTVQRWEKTLALPVRRIGTGRGEVVYALPDELDAWRAAAESTRDLSETPAEREADHGAAVVAVPGGGDAAPGAARAQADEGARAEPAGVEPPPAEKTAAAGVRVRRHLAVSLLALAGLAVVFFAWRGWTSPAAEPSDYVWDVDTLHVIDAKGRELWTDRFERPVPKEAFNERMRGLNRDPVVIEDLDGDGSREVVFAYRPGMHGQNEVRGYSASGRPLFRARFDGTIRFGETRYSPPWGPYRLFVTDAPGGGKWLWAVWTHETGEFPTLLQRLSLDGKGQASVWSAGYVEWVQVAEVGGRPSVLVGAANNDHQGAGLALFDVDAFAGSLPAETWDKTCRDCQPGGPRKLLVFPRLDVLGLLGGIPSVVSTARQATGEFRVYVDHGSLVPGRNGLDWGDVIAYDLSPGLTPVLAEFTAGYIAAHDRHHEAGLLDHPFGDADRAAAWPVLVWENGVWTRVMGSTDR